MTGSTINLDIEVFSTCPQSSTASPGSYLENVVSVARWSEECGCKGILVYTDNSLVDPWIVSQVILQNTTSLCPLVAVQPAYMHPYSVAKMVASLGHLYGRRLYLNMVAGGFTTDLAALNDTTPHDKRYARLVEYTMIINKLLGDQHPVNFDGEFYKVRDLRMMPPLQRDLTPGVFLSGSSEAGLTAARTLKATAVKYPKPAREYCESADEDIDSGIRVGIITRENDEDAWKVAQERFPEDRKGQVTHQVAMKVSDSSWHKQLSQLAFDTKTARTPYWLRPFENYKTFCPYLVGSYEIVSEELAMYMAAGYSTFILDIPPNQEELSHVGCVFRMATERRVLPNRDHTWGKALTI